MYLIVIGVIVDRVLSRSNQLVPCALQLTLDKYHKRHLSILRAHTYIYGYNIVFAISNLTLAYSLLSLSASIALYLLNCRWSYHINI